MQNMEEIVTTGRCCPIGSWGESREISLLRARAHSVSVSCCPIEISEFEDPESIPDDASNESKDAGEAVGPLGLECDESQENIEQESRPELPANGVFRISEEVADFEGLLDLFEEGLDAPAPLVKVADAGGCPLQIVGQKNHDFFFSVDFDERFDSTQSLRILSLRLWSDQSDLVITQNLTRGVSQTFATNMVEQIILGACDPEDASLMQLKKAVKMNIGLVKNRDLPVLESGAKGQSACAVVMRSFFNDGEGGKETLQVQAQVHLRSCLTSPMLGPVHAVGNQRNSGGINRINSFFETMWQSAIATTWSKTWTKLLKMPEHLPEKFLHHVAVAMFVCVRESVARRRYSTSNRSQLRGMMPECVTHIVESNRMGKLGKYQTHHVTPRRECAGLLIHTMFTGKFFRHMRRDEFTKLMQCVRVILGRRYCFHTPDSLVGIRRRPPFLIRLKQNLQIHPVG